MNAVYPGSTDTEINRHLSYHSSYISSIFVKPFTWMFIQSARQGATPVWTTAIHDDLKDVTGCYFRFVGFFPLFKYNSIKLK